uniref:Uncharacterized protein n=1 Tax=Arundo donax TaxID=35708 RepID=A0A0A9H5R3_ARUDO
MNQLSEMRLRTDNTFCKHMKLNFPCSRKCFKILKLNSGLCRPNFKMT